MEPWKPASPNENTPPSLATSQYPWPSVVGAIPTIGAFRCWPPMEPSNGSVAEGEDAAVRPDEPVTLAVGRRGNPDDGRVEVLAAE